MSAPEVERFAAKSSITLKRVGERVVFTARFLYKSARYEVDGALDAGKQRVEPLHHRLVLGGKKVFDATLLLGKDSLRSEFQFGNATKGVRELVLRSRHVQDDSVYVGAADGQEIVPYYLEGCGCESENLRPVLVWNEDNSTQPLELQLTVPRAALAELEGLSEVTQTTIARVNNGSFGDTLGPLSDCIGFAICLITCGLGQLSCHFHPKTGPFSNLRTVCMVLYSDCFSWCRVTKLPW